VQCVVVFVCVLTAGGCLAVIAPVMQGTVCVVVCCAVLCCAVLCRTF